MRLEIDIPEHHYNNIMALDSVCLGRAPYKGIIMYAINAIKQGKVLEQELTTKNDLGVDCISRAEAIRVASGYCHPSNVAKELAKLPSVTPQEPRKGHWIKVTNGRGGHECDVCHDYAPSFQSGNEYLSAFCPNCGVKMAESEK